MRKSKHTPGPWHFDEDLGWVNCDNAYGKGFMNIAEVRGWGHLVGVSTCNMEADDAMAIQAANGILAASSPDLLDACEKALAHVRELREAWRTGALGECDGRGGQRSNRNVDVEVALAKAIAKATPAPAVNETP